MYIDHEAYGSAVKSPGLLIQMPSYKAWDDIMFLCDPVPGKEIAKLAENVSNMDADYNPAFILFINMMLYNNDRWV